MVSLDVGFAAKPQLVLDRGAAALDLPRRLVETPATASVRGLFFNMIRDELQRRGMSDHARKILGGPHRIYGLYPVREFLSAYAEAAALIEVAPEEGARQIFLGGSGYFANTWLGRTFQRFLRPDPAGALEWLERSREHFCNYGRWRLELLAPDHAVLHMFEEYIWIDSAHKGGCEGLLLACGVTGVVTPSLDSPYSGRLEIRWTPQR